MYTEILRGIEGIGVFPIISLLLFVAVFSVVIIWAIRADRTRLDQHAALPLIDAPAPDPATPHDLFSGRRA